MSGVNKVILVGRLGRDPEMRSTPQGNHACNLSIATSETWLKDGKKEEKTEWHRVIFWGKNAENASKYLNKGSMVYVEGKLQTRKWRDKEGIERFTTEILGNSMNFISTSEKDSDSKKQIESNQIEDDDIPF